MTTLNDMPDADVLTIEEVAGALRVGRSVAYAAARSGEIPTIRVGRCLRVPRWLLEQKLGANNEHEPGVNGLVSKGDVDSAVQRDPCEA